MEALDPTECDFALILERAGDNNPIREALQQRGLIWAPDQDIPGKSNLFALCIRAADVSVLAQVADEIGLPKRKVANDKFNGRRAMPFSLKAANTFEGWDKVRHHMDSPVDAVALMRQKNAVPSSLGEFFTTAQRHELVEELLEGDRGTSKKGHSNILHSPLVQAAFPIHNQSQVKQLWKMWSRATFNLPLLELQRYFGAHTVYYAAFMQTYNKMLIVPALLGIYFMAFEDANTSMLVPIFSLAAIVWAAVFLKAWQRRSSELAADWGTLYYEATEEGQRREFWGEERVSEATFLPELYYPEWKRNIRRAVSGVVVFALLSVAVGIMFLSLNLQGYVKDDSMFFYAPLNGIFDPDGWFTIIPTIVHSVVIYVINQMIYRPLSERLTEFENYKTQIQFENALLFKRVTIECFDCYLPLFYICVHGKSLGQLRMELIGLFIGDILRRVATEMILPYLFQNAMRKIAAKTDKGKQAGSGADKPLTGYWPGDDLYKDEYEEFDDYLEMVVQFGYIVLFAGAFPAGALLALGSNMLELRSDAYKLLYLSRKPPSKRAASVGGWSDVMYFFAGLAVITNCYIFGFESNQLSSIFPMLEWKAGQARYILLIVFALEHFMFALQFMIHWLVPSQTHAVRVLRERDIFLAKRVAALAAGVEN